jgi:hypothetical protein
LPPHFSYDSHQPAFFDFRYAAMRHYASRHDHFSLFAIYAIFHATPLQLYYYAILLMMISPLPFFAAAAITFSAD